MKGVLNCDYCFQMRGDGGELTEKHQRLSVTSLSFYPYTPVLYSTHDTLALTVLTQLCGVLQYIRYRLHVFLCLL